MRVMRRWREIGLLIELDRTILVDRSAIYKPGLLAVVVSQLTERSEPTLHWCGDLLWIDSSSNVRHDIRKQPD